MKLQAEVGEQKIPMVSTELEIETVKELETKKKEKR